jgi:hypothetical protein
MTEPITAADVGHGADERARVVVVGRADEYRRRAQQCLEMAAAFRDRDARVAQRRSGGVDDIGLAKHGIRNALAQIPCR